MFALFLYLTLYLQNYLGYSPLQAGIRYLPITVAAFVVAPIAGVLLGRVQARVLLAGGLALAGVGLLLMSGIDASAEWTTLLLGFIVAGIGVGLLNPVIADVALSVVPKEQSGMASGINDTFRQVGISVGIATWGALFLGRGADKVSSWPPEPPPPRRPPTAIDRSGVVGQPQPGASSVPDGARATVAHAAREGFLAGMNEILLLGALLSIAGSLLALLLVREGEIEREEMVRRASATTAAGPRRRRSGLTVA